jgi:hypothetical protein
MLTLDRGLDRKNAAAQHSRLLSALGPSADFVKRLLRAQNKRLFFQQIGRRIAAHRKLREDHKIGTQSSGTLRKLNNLPRIPGEVSNRGIDLGKRDLHPTSLSSDEA